MGHGEDQEGPEHSVLKSRAVRLSYAQSRNLIPLPVSDYLDHALAPLFWPRSSSKEGGVCRPPGHCPRVPWHHGSGESPPGRLGAGVGPVGVWSAVARIRSGLRSSIDSKERTRGGVFGLNLVSSLRSLQMTNHSDRKASRDGADRY